MASWEFAFAVAEVCVTVEGPDTREEAEEEAERLIAKRDIFLCHACSACMETCDPYVTAIYKDGEPVEVA